MTRGIEINVNNAQTLVIDKMPGENGNITMATYTGYNDKDIPLHQESFTSITESDFVMLMNYYKYIKDNNLKCDFINPNGK